ncbi:MAG: hypothetical protein AAFU53_18260 [Cyanobacteria bacterium J06632_3]
MIEQIIRVQPEPVPQTGQVTTFNRRKPHESELSQVRSLPQLHDFIRMLDAEGYPKAFLEHQGFRYEFSRSSLQHDRIIADVTITPLDDSPAKDFLAKDFSTKDVSTERTQDSLGRELST